MNWVLDGSGVLLVLSGLVALGYELFALFTRKVPTITDVVRNWEASDTAHKAVVSGILIVAVAGIVGLGAHFLGGF